MNPSEHQQLTTNNRFFAAQHQTVVEHVVTGLLLHWLKDARDGELRIVAVMRDECRKLRGLGDASTLANLGKVFPQPEGLLC